MYVVHVHVDCIQVVGYYWVRVVLAYRLRNGYSIVVCVVEVIGSVLTKLCVC